MHPGNSCGPYEEKLINNIFNERKYQMLSRPVAKEKDLIKVKLGLALQQIVKVVRKAS